MKTLLQNEVKIKQGFWNPSITIFHIFGYFSNQIKRNQPPQIFNLQYRLSPFEHYFKMKLYKGLENRFVSYQAIEFFRYFLVLFNILH